MNASATKNATARHTLKNLIQILHDGQEGFRHASEHVTDASLKELFSRYSLQRSQFAGELQTELHDAGEADPQKEGNTIIGTVHRSWLDLKAAFTQGDRHAVLAEAERGEDAAKAAYRDALNEPDLSATLQETLTRQAAKIQQAHDEVKRLRDEAQ